MRCYNYVIIKILMQENAYSYDVVCFYVAAQCLVFNVSCCPVFIIAFWGK
jgi:hypothetical protein